MKFTNTKSKTPLFLRSIEAKKNNQNKSNSSLKNSQV